VKQVEDTKTGDLLDSSGKRGRGRPSKPDALTGAERARRFRENRKLQPKEEVKKESVTVTEKEYRDLLRAEQNRTMALASAHAEIRILLARLVEKDAEISALKIRRKSVKK